MSMFKRILFHWIFKSFIKELHPHSGRGTREVIRSRHRLKDVTLIASGGRIP